MAAKLSCDLVIPLATRWNSTYGSVVRVKELREKDRTALDVISAAAEVQPLFNHEAALLEEWARVMQCVEDALDHLQGDQAMYLGYLLLTVVLMKEYLADESANAQKCQTLVDMLVEGLTRGLALALNAGRCWWQQHISHHFKWALAHGGAAAKGPLVSDGGGHSHSGHI